MTQTASLVHDLEGAFDDGDAERAVAIYEELTAELADRSIQDVLAEFKTAVNNEDWTTGAQLLQTLQAKYDAQRPDEQARQQQALSIRERTAASTDTLQTVDTYLQLATATQLERSSFMMQAALLLAKPDTVDETEVTDAATSLKTREQSLDASANQVDTTSTDVTLPPALAILTIDGTDTALSVTETRTLSITIGNVGDKTAESVDATITPSDGLSAASTQLSIGSINAGGRVTRDVAITGTAAGDQSVTIEVTAASGATASDVVELSVTDGDGSQTIVEQYDRDGDGTIDNQELLAALADYPDQVTSQELLDLLAVYEE